MENMDRLIEIIEDRAALETGLRVVMETAERRRLPEEVFLPTFNDAMLEDLLRRTLEKVAGEKY